MTEHTDVVIAGGGPSGSTAATLLAKAGLRVIVLESETFPRFHIGESLLPQSYRIWERLGIVDQLEARYIRKYGARFVDCRTERSETYAFEDAFHPTSHYAFQVPRADFDDLLLRHAATCGAVVRHGWTVREVMFDRDVAVGVRASDADGTVHEIFARVVLDATGRDTLLASRVRTKWRIPGLDKTAVFGHFVGVERQTGRAEGTIDIVVFPHGWFWNIPFRGEVNSVGVVCSSTWMRARRSGETLDAFFTRTLDDAGWMKRTMAGAQRINPARALADFSYRVDRLAGDGWAMIGDAAGFLDPLFSTGAHLAFRGAEMAADHIVAELGAGRPLVAASWSAYETELRSGADLFLGAVQAFYDGTLSELVFQQPQRRVLRQTITSMLAGDVFDSTATWARFLRERFAARLPEGDAPVAPAGATPMIE